MIKLWSWRKIYGQAIRYLTSDMQFIIFWSFVFCCTVHDYAVGWAQRLAYKTTDQAMSKSVFRDYGGPSAPVNPGKSKIDCKRLYVTITGCL